MERPIEYEEKKVEPTDFDARGSEKVSSQMDFTIWGTTISISARAIVLFLVFVVLFLFVDVYLNVKPYQRAWKEDESRLQRIESKLSVIENQIRAMGVEREARVSE